MTKLTDLIRDQKKFSYSFEVTPDVNIEEIVNLCVDPTFYSVTWHAKSHQCKDLEIEPLKLVSVLRSAHKQVLLHLSCDLLKKQYLDQVLVVLQNKGVCNLFVVLGEKYDPDLSDFKSTLELIQYIKERTGEYFCIGIPGFPECSDEKLLQMKGKIDCGADFIITQAFFDPGLYKTFVDKCEEVGIEVPIIPGVFYFETYKQLYSFMNMCKIKVSTDILSRVKNLEDVDIPGLEVINNLIKGIKTDYPSTNFHFFTMNKLQNVLNFIKQLQ